jgi:hypothetical protein
LGGNDTGKSCLIKSIYATFGAEPAIVHPDWRSAQVITMIKYSLGDNTFYILKYLNWFSIFDREGNILEHFEGITKGLHEYISNMFDFRLKLLNRQGIPVTPPPSFLFLPYYIDQDSSWNQNWSSFARLAQFTNWRETIVYYHTGIRPNQYYETKSSIELLNNVIKENDKELIILKNILAKIKSQISESHFDIDINSFKNEINNLLFELENLNQKENKLKSALTDLYNIKISLETRIKITQLALAENQKDYSFSLEELEEDYICCPTCGAEYQNSFSERFSIATDGQRCEELLLQLNIDLLDINKKIAHTDSDFVSTIEEKQKIEEYLLIKQGEIKLKDVIDSEGRKQVRTIFEQQLKDIRKKIDEKMLKLNSLNKMLKSYENKKRKNDIIATFQSLMSIFLNELDVKSLQKASYNKISAKIVESGSTLPRALAAYYFSILHLIYKNSDSVFCPIIIDEPNQQGQDKINLPNFLKFIKTRIPNDSQLILGLESTEGIDFHGKTIKVSQKNSLLQKNEYEEVYSFMKPFINQTLHRKGEFMF